MDYLELREVMHASSSLLWHIYRFALIGVLRLIWGKNWAKKLSESPTIKKILSLPRNRFFCYYVRSIGIDFVQSKLPDGDIVQPLDSLPENYAIYRSGVFDAFYEIRDDAIVIDIGAHVGIFTLKAARKARKGVIVAVEPHPMNFKLLKYNISKNGVENVLAVNLALSNFCGTTNLYIGTDSVSHTIDNRRGKAKTYVTKRFMKVKTLTLDQLIGKLKLPRVDFIKINAEGAELSILKGAEKTLEKNNVTLTIAADHYPKEIQDIIGYLRRKKYEVFTYNYMHFVQATRKRANYTSR